MAFRPNPALRFRAIDAVNWPHFGVTCALQEQLTLLIVLDTQPVLLALGSLGLYSHLQCPIIADDVPFPVGAILGLLFLGKRLKTNLFAVPSSDLKQILFRDRLFSVTDVHVFSMGELEIAGRRVS